MLKITHLCKHVYGRVLLAGRLEPDESDYFVVGPKDLILSCPDCYTKIIANQGVNLMELDEPIEVREDEYTW